MIRALIISLLLASFSVVSAQDLIVTDEGDSLNCTITRKTSDYLYFTFKHESDVRNTLIPLSDVKTYEEDYFDHVEVTTDKTVKLDDYEKWRFDFNIGYSYRLAEIPDDLEETAEDYIRQLKSGFSYGGDIIYFWSEQLGVGLKANIFSSSNSIDESEIDFKSTYDGAGVYSDDVTICFAGAQYAIRLYDNKRVNAWFFSVALGYMAYEDIATAPSQQVITYSGECFASGLDIGYDFAIDAHWSFGLQASYIGGVLKEMTVEDAVITQTYDLEEEQYEGLQRVDVLVGLRYSF